jgi:hypothetical protein
METRDEMFREMRKAQAHMFMLSFLGHTTKHLREIHHIEPAEDKRERCAQHMEAHGMKRTAPNLLYKWVGFSD